MQIGKVGWEIIGYVKRGDGVAKHPDHYAICECHEKVCGLPCRQWVNLSREEQIPIYCKKAGFAGRIETILQCPGCTEIHGCDAVDIFGGYLRRRYCASCSEQCDGRPKGISRISHGSCPACDMEVSYEAKHPEQIRFYAAVLAPGRI